MHRYVSPVTGLVVAFAVSLSLLLGAHAFERLGGMAPCLLCLDQREAHWTALFISGGALIATRLNAGVRLLSAGLGALTVVYIFSAGLAGYHAGVEWGFWPGPAACAAGGPNMLLTQPGGMDALSALTDTRDVAPACETAAWRMLGLSMAGYNTLISAGLAVLVGLSCFAAREAWRGRFGVPSSKAQQSAAQ